MKECHRQYYNPAKKLLSLSFYSRPLPTLVLALTVRNETYCCWQHTRFSRKCQHGAFWEAARCASEGWVRYRGVKALCLSETSNQDKLRKRSDFYCVSPCNYGKPWHPLTFIYWLAHLEQPLHGAWIGSWLLRDMETSKTRWLCCGSIVLSVVLLVYWEYLIGPIYKAPSDVEFHGKKYFLMNIKYRIISSVSISFKLEHL